MSMSKLTSDGLDRFFEKGQQTRTSTFKTAAKNHLPDKAGSYELFGDRVTKLGKNM